MLTVQITRPIRDIPYTARFPACSPRCAPSLVLLIRNDSTEDRVATIETAATPEGLAVEDVDVPVPAGELAAVPMHVAYKNEATRGTVVTLDNPADVGLALLHW